MSKPKITIQLIIVQTFMKLISFSLIGLSPWNMGNNPSQNALPIMEFPINKKTEDKTGCLVVWERPVKDPNFGDYYASVDPVSEGKTTTSESLCSIYVMKAPIQVTRHTGSESETYIEQGKIVAAWCGRYDDINQTHRQLELIIEWYNAWALVENNISLFIRIH